MASRIRTSFRGTLSYLLSGRCLRVKSRSFPMMLDHKTGFHQPSRSPRRFLKFKEANPDHRTGSHQLSHSHSHWLLHKAISLPMTLHHKAASHQRWWALRHHRSLSVHHKRLICFTFPRRQGLQETVQLPHFLQASEVSATIQYLRTSSEPIYRLFDLRLRLHRARR